MRTMSSIVAPLATILVLFTAACDGSSLTALEEAAPTAPSQTVGNDDEGVDPLTGDDKGSPDTDSWGSGSSGSGSSGSGGSSSNPSPAPDCGPNSFDNGLGGCVCEVDYDWCAGGDTAVGCCAFGTDTFTVTFVSAEVLPYADPSSKKPWDWSGTVPGWIQDLVEVVITYVDEDAQDWIDILDYVYYFAPELLEGTVPPDPFVEVEIGSTVVFSSTAIQDDLEPWWEESTTLSLAPSSELTVWYVDEDLALDDTIEGAIFTGEDLQWYAGLGDLTFEGQFGAYSFTIAIDPVF